MGSLTSMVLEGACDMVVWGLPPGDSKGACQPGA